MGSRIDLVILSAALLGAGLLVASPGLDDARAGAEAAQRASSPGTGASFDAWIEAAAPPLPMPAEAQTCRAPEPGAPTAAEKLAEVRARLAAEVAPDEDVVVLNSRGYNYGPAEAIDPALLQFEARHLAPR